MEQIHTVYKITNKLDRKIYIGVHSTFDVNDSYMGSGKRLKRAQDKYGLENFEKEILFVYNDSKPAYEKEAELVDEDFVNRKDTYNMKLGGEGGKNSKLSENHKKKISLGKSGKNHQYYGKTRSEETKKKISETLKNRKLSESHMKNLKKPHILSMKKCPHCHKEGKGPNMTRYHFDKCKHKDMEK